MYDWLRTTILIEPPTVIQAQYESLDQRHTPPRAISQGPESLAERIKHHRRALGLTQVEAAEQIDIPPGDLNRVEHGQQGRSLSPGVQRKIQQWLARGASDGR
jgi:ribosome-binding protein aMBF1 (putative translation factor)